MKQLLKGGGHHDHDGQFVARKKKKGLKGIQKRDRMKRGRGLDKKIKEEGRVVQG